MRQTSADAYRIIKENGLLSSARLNVYSALYEYGPCTGAELFYKMDRTRNPTHSNVTTRLGELREMKAVYEKCIRPCSVTGMNVIEWEVTTEIPIKYKIKDSYKSRFLKLKACMTEVYKTIPEAKTVIEKHYSTK